MNLYEACVFRLAEKEFLSENAARLLAVIMAKGSLNELQLSERTGLSLDETVTVLTELDSLKAIQIYGGRYFCTDKDRVLLSLVDETELEAELVAVNFKR